MGLTFISEELPGSYTPAQVKAWLERVKVKAALYLSGDWSLCREVTFEQVTEEVTLEAARQRMLKQESKNYALATLCDKKIVTYTITPTYGGEEQGYCGLVAEVRGGKFAAHDQLPPQIKVKVVKLVETLRNAHLAHAEACDALDEALDQIRNGRQPHQKALRALQRAKFSKGGVRTREALMSRLSALEKRWEPVIRPARVTIEKVWLIGAWASGTNGRDS